MVGCRESASGQWSNCNSFSHQDLHIHAFLINKVQKLLSSILLMLLFGLLLLPRFGLKDCAV